MSWTLVTPTDAACCSARFDGVQPLIRRHLRNGAGDELHRRVLEHASRKPARVADDDAAGRIRGRFGHAGAAERRRIGQRHVAIVPAHEDRRAVGAIVDQLAGRQRRR